MPILIGRLVFGFTLLSAVGALELTVTNKTSIKQVAAKVAEGIYAYHNSSSTVGQFNQPQPWFWWLSGNGWNGLLDYTVYTQDTTYQADLLDALAKNVGDNFDFMPAAQASWEANDDQAYWVFNALTAMEYNFTALPCKASSSTGGAGGCANSWLAISTNAFELYVDRWRADAKTCGGGLKWQFNPKANGYTYKNAVSNAAFFQVAARLARYTGNQTFADWATKVWDWSLDIGLISPDYHVYDGTGDENTSNCSSMNNMEWTYNVASYMHGAAHMYASTPDNAKWEEITRGLVFAARNTFFTPFANATHVMYEQICEKTASCSTDQTSFKSSLSRWMGKTAVLVPSVRSTIMELLTASATAAAISCDGLGNSTCGMRWYTGAYDGHPDFGTALSALDVVQSLLVFDAPTMAVAEPCPSCSSR